MKYETYTDEIDGQTVTYLTYFPDENTSQTFLVDESNADYMAFIEANPEALKKVRAS
jgi:hypothetical protein